MKCVFSVASGLVDEQQKVRTISALAIAALAEAATPYGIESFDSVLKPLWKGIRQHRGKVGCQRGTTWQINLLFITSRNFTFEFPLIFLSLSSGSGCFPQSYRLSHPADGCRVCKLLHQRGDADPHQRVPVSRRGDEKDCAEGK